MNWCCHYDEGFDDGRAEALRGMTGNEIADALRLYARRLDRTFELEQSDQVRALADRIEREGFFAPRVDPIGLPIGAAA